MILKIFLVHKTILKPIFLKYQIKALVTKSFKEMSSSKLTIIVNLIDLYRVAYSIFFKAQVLDYFWIDLKFKLIDFDGYNGKG